MNQAAICRHGKFWSGALLKCFRWNKQGLEAMLFDDGLDVDDTEVKVKSKGQVAISDLNELLERKYEMLKNKLIWEMAKQAAGRLYCLTCKILECKPFDQ